MLNSSLRLALFAGFIALTSCATSPLPNTTASDPGVVHHPAPKEPKLIDANLLPEFKKSPTLPPEKGSDNQGRDEEELFAAQKTRTAEDCVRANSEVKVTLTSFFGQPYGPLSASEVAPLDSFFDQIRNDADYYIQLLKKEFPRPRPFTYLKELSPCVPREVTGAYPSGHATLARLYALILGDLYPERKKAFETRAEIIARDRIVGGVHHLTDIRAGKELGERIYAKLKRSPQYQAMFKDLANRK